LDYELEIRRAISQGLDGFIYECPQQPSADARWNRLTSKGGKSESERESERERERERESERG
jgi:hypothetical protein